jgi:hypothetical protein
VAVDQSRAVVAAAKLLGFPIQFVVSDVPQLEADVVMAMLLRAFRERGQSLG